MRATLSDLAETGAKLRYIAVDVRDEAAFGALIDDVYATYGRLDGVIHGAGVIEDKLVLDKTPESFNRVFDTKVDSAFVLAHKLRPESLKFLAFFSSVTARFGNRGQADYGATNDVINKMAVALDACWPAHVISYNWGPWGSGGMVSAEVEAQFARRGVELIQPEIGWQRAVEEVLFGTKGEVEIVYGNGPWGLGMRRMRYD
jgi:NAD(P)-dependent dehydrogenase (short-subunit alcohol dehydrogenase family)